MPKSKRKSPNENAFKMAVEATADVSTCYQVGLRALGPYSSKIVLENTSKCDGSLDIDACTTALYPTDNRWDYAISYNSKVYFIEVHSAETSEVSTVLRKLQWLKDWLNENAPEIKKMNAPEPYFWIQSGRYNILSTSQQAKEIAKKGLKPIPKLSLPLKS